MNPEAKQHPEEFAAFTTLLQREGVTSYLEIGSKRGGSLWLVAAALPPGSLVVSVDKPNGTANHEVLRATIAKIWSALLVLPVSIIGDSTDPKIVANVRALAPFDAVFIDGDHSMSGVESDWMNYGCMGRIVAFHDIAWKRKRGETDIEVPQFWERIKQGRRYEEITLDRQNNGIGVLWNS